MEVECKICKRKTGLIKASSWYEIKWGSPEGTFQIRSICPKCAYELDEELQKTLQKVKKKRRKIEGK